MNEPRDIWDDGYFRAGWQRWLPPSAFVLHTAVFQTSRRDVAGDLDVLAASDDSFARLLALVGDLDDPTQKLMAKTESGYGEAVGQDNDRFGRVCNAAGVDTVRTPRDMYRLLEGLGLVRRTSMFHNVIWRTRTPVPLPESVVDMTRAERDLEDLLRWHTIFAPVADVIAPYVAEALTRATPITIADIATRCDLDPLEVREALVLLDHLDVVRLDGNAERADTMEPLFVAPNPAP